MGSSVKRKSDKKKDFQKPKLKVGKARPKPSNLTITSFKSKNIVVKKQSIDSAIPSSSSQFFHHISLLSARSESLRKESLNYLSSVLAVRSSSYASDDISGALLLKALPLILDGCDGVRDRLLATLKHLHGEDIQDHAERILLFIRAGMTHIAAGVRQTAMDVLAWALQIAGRYLVSCAGGWLKTLRYFTIMLGWQVDSNHNPLASKALIYPAASDYKLTVKILSNLDTYLLYGLTEHIPQKEMGLKWPLFPLFQTTHHLASSNPSTYAYLNLYKASKHEEDDIYGTRIDRQTVFRRCLQDAIETGLAGLTRRGGDVGRTSARIQNTIAQGMAGFSSVQVDGATD